MAASRKSHIWIYAVLLLLAAFFLIPVYLMVITSLKPASEATLAQMWDFPSTIDWQSYVIAYEKLAPSLMNSFYLAIPATLLSSLLGSLNGYILAKWRFRGANTLFTLILFGMFIPYQSILIPLIQFLQQIGLYNSIPGLILVHVVYGIPITTLIFRNFYAGIPTEIIESAKIDGNGIWGVYQRIILPLSIPGFVVVGIWQFTQIWNEFLFAVTITNTTQQPIMVALQNLAGSQIVQWNIQMAGSLLAALPTLLVYIFLGRYFIRGLLAGSLKG
ncbi:carbohydrate ABC transporter permease [Paenactinomyces guangxiensis]|uniref:Carbohydrate ABC transporter permease n=1 Tax=Paenactinomyces guangxiensis TaxID=1490290 RepID=A0A7W1WSK4_9BACL|nr:carbohydrate ABC transporter permease [Paenactinomyces guangxiensis]MBA4495208.1 carbohydrate ABC transporter permease [Paenactinomyces guangxiensis]MBH8592292.1 carbohydrate ABC transporter permease [Paenactinomyces guangxiensis]